MKSFKQRVQKYLDSLKDEDTPESASAFATQVNSELQRLKYNQSLTNPLKNENQDVSK